MVVYDLSLSFFPLSLFVFGVGVQTDTLFTCYVCDRTFPCSEELTQHQASHSQEDKPFRCPYCQGSFRTFSEVRGGGGGGGRGSDD